MAYTLEPQSRARDSIVIQKQTGEKQAEEHHQTANQIGHTTVADDDTNKQTDISGRQVEQDQNQHEMQELRPGSDQSRHRINDHAHDNGRDKSQRDNVKHNLGGKVGHWVIVPIGTFPDK